MAKSHSVESHATAENSRESFESSAEFSVDREKMILPVDSPFSLGDIQM